MPVSEGHQLRLELTIDLDREWRSHRLQQAFIGRGFLRRLPEGLRPSQDQIQAFVGAVLALPRPEGWWPGEEIER